MKEVILLSSGREALSAGKRTGKAFCVYFTLQIPGHSFHLVISAKASILPLFLGRTGSLVVTLLVLLLLHTVFGEGPSLK